MKNFNWNKTDLLEIVEYYAESVGAISSEEQLSELFDENFSAYIFANNLKDDEPAVNEMFCNWVDGLVKDGDLHEEQAQHYCYCGEFE